MLRATRKHELTRGIDHMSRRNVEESTRTVSPHGGELESHNFWILHTAIPLATADGHTAVEYVKRHAGEFGISPDKIGIMGFSAGGTVTAAAALGGNNAN